MKLLKGFLIAAAANALAIAALTPRLPEQVPIHLNYAGVVDGFGPRWSLAALALIPVAVLLLQIVVGRGMQKQNKKLQALIGAGVTVLLFIMDWYMVWLAFDTERANIASVQLFICIPLGLLMLFIGNYLGTVKHNYFLGIRTKWTLESEEVWRETHRKGAYFMVAGGIAMIAGALGTFFTGIPWIAIAGLVVFLFLGAVLPVVYSYVISKK